MSGGESGGGVSQPLGWRVNGFAGWREERLVEGYPTNDKSNAISSIFRRFCLA